MKALQPDIHSRNLSMLSSFFYTVFILLLCSPAIAKEVNEPVRISYCANFGAHRLAIEAVREAYLRSNIPATFHAQPCKRSLVAANAGEFDAEMGRISGIERHFKNLHPSSSPFYSFEGVVLSKRVRKDIQNWDDLKGLRIGILRGQVFAQKGTKGLKPINVDSYKQMIALILNGRIDVGIGMRRELNIIRLSLGAAGNNLQFIGQPLFKGHLYHLVHNRYRHLLAILDPIFKIMWENGETAAINRQTQKEYEKRPQKVAPVPIRKRNNT